MKNSNNKSHAAILRQKAEELLKASADSTIVKPPSLNDRKTHQFSEVEALKLIHELEVHQIELELQNDQLSRAWALAEVANDKYIGLYDFAPSGYFTLSKEGKMMELNLCGSQMLGKERSYLINKTFGFFVSADTKPVFNLFFGKVFISRTKESCEVTLSPNGNLPMYVHLTGIVTENGEQCLITVVDITGRKQVEEALKDSESHARALIAAIPDMVFMLDRQGVYLDFKAAKEDLAYQSQSIIGLKNRDITPPEFADLVDEKIELTLQTGQMQVFEYQLPLPKGISEFEARMVPNSHNEVIAIVRNITERKKTEAEIKLKNEQLFNANAEKDKFFSIIAHDLRSPFNAFLGLTQMLVEDLDTFTLKEIQQIAVSMRNSATNIYGLLENLLEWSRIRRGVTTFEPATFLLTSIIAESLKSILESANKKGITIRFEIPENMKVFADKYMLGSTIRNLVSNAMKFTSKGGEITIAATSTIDNSDEISIKDTGIGMDKNMTDNLFRLGEHTNRKGTEGEPSTGLGLIICREFVEKHGGRLWVNSEEGKGSTFCFSLPHIHR